MKNKFIENNTLISLVNWIGIPISIGYVLSMLIAPWIAGCFSWTYVQNVWDRWQTFNVGILAFISSVIAFKVATFSENKKRERQFIAARAFLPHALSELTSYCKLSALVLTGAWEHTNIPIGRRTSTFNEIAPNLPDDYKEVFSRCIESAEPYVGDYLASILVLLQIHNSRLKDLVKSFLPGSSTVIVQDNVMSYLYSLGKMQALINKLFTFARGANNFDDSPLTFDDYHTAYSNLGILLDRIEGLHDFTQRAVDRKS